MTDAISCEVQATISPLHVTQTVHTALMQLELQCSGQRQWEGNKKFTAQSGRQPWQKLSENTRCFLFCLAHYYRQLSNVLFWIQSDYTHFKGKQASSTLWW